MKKFKSILMFCLFVLGGAPLFSGGVRAARLARIAAETGEPVVRKVRRVRPAGPRGSQHRVRMDKEAEGIKQRGIKRELEQAFLKEVNGLLLEFKTGSFVCASDKQLSQLPPLDASTDDLRVFLLQGIYKKLFTRFCSSFFATVDLSNASPSAEVCDMAIDQIKNDLSVIPLSAIKAKVDALRQVVAQSDADAFAESYKGALVFICRFAEYAEAVEEKPNVLGRCKKHQNIEEATRLAEAAFDRGVSLFLKRTPRS